MDGKVPASPDKGGLGILCFIELGKELITSGSGNLLAKPHNVSTSFKFVFITHQEIDCLLKDYRASKQTQVALPRSRTLHVGPSRDFATELMNVMGFSSYSLFFLLHWASSSLVCSATSCSNWVPAYLRIRLQGQG